MLYFEIFTRVQPEPQFNKKQDTNPEMTAGDLQQTDYDIQKSDREDLIQDKKYYGSDKRGKQNNRRELIAPTPFDQGDYDTAQSSQQQRNLNLNRRSSRVPVICEIAEHENLENSNVTISDNKDPSPLQQQVVLPKKSQVTPKPMVVPDKKTKVCCKGCLLF